MPDETKKKYTRANCSEPIDAFLAIANELAELNETLVDAFFVDGDSVTSQLRSIHYKLENEQGDSILTDIATALGTPSASDD